MTTEPIRIDSQDFHSDPFTAFDDLRQRGPVVRAKLPIIGKIWLTTTHAATIDMLKDSQRFRMRKKAGSSQPRDVAGVKWWMPRTIRLLANNMLSSDDPQHRRLRKAVDLAFNRRSVMQLGPNIDGIANQLLDQMDSDIKTSSGADLVSRYARKLPLAVISDLLGIEQQRRTEFERLAGQITRVSSAWDFVMMLRPLAQIRKLLEGEIERAGHLSGDDGDAGLIVNLLHPHDGEKRLTDDELLAMVFLLLFAGHETTTHLISGSVLALFEHEDQRRWLSADPARYDLAVEEFLRFVSPVQMSKPRFVQSTGDFHGAALARGDMIMAGLAAANYDPAHVDLPRQLQLDRTPNPHVEFGTGIHFCLGFQLARLELKVALNALFERYPDLMRIDQQAKWVNRTGLRALDSLRVHSN